MQSSRSMTVLEFRIGQAPDKIELLAGLQPQEIDLILSAGRLRRFSPKSVMTRQGNSADHLLLLWRGRARYFFETQNGKKLNLRPITPGHVFGGAALVSGHSSYLVSTEAMQNSVVLVWERPTIRALARRFKLLLENALLAALDHFDWYVSAYASLSSQPARERLAGCRNPAVFRVRKSLFFIQMWFRQMARFGAGAPSAFVSQKTGNSFPSHFTANAVGRLPFTLTRSGHPVRRAGKKTPNRLDFFLLSGIVILVKRHGIPLCPALLCSPAARYLKIFAVPF